MSLNWLFVALLAVLPAALAHIRLTFPKARYPDLDFLDNVRTGFPCGVPYDAAKKRVTVVQAGSTITIEWHLGFAHRGGLIFSLLANGFLYELNSGWVRGSDPTTLRYNVTLPTNVTCTRSGAHDCTLQVRRQALEWDQGYAFHTCADLNVVANPSVATQCSSLNGKPCYGHGTCSNGVCACNRRFSGRFCQNEDECVDNSDCGGSAKGTCVDTQSTSYPKKQCYCRSGWFGKQCTKASELKDALIVESGYYDNKFTFKEGFYFYWKFFDKITPEIEIALKVRTSSWVGLGWRPTNINSTCQNTPAVLLPGQKINPVSVVKPSSEPEPESTTKPKPEVMPEATTEPKPEATSEPKPSSTPEPKVTPETTTEPKPEGTKEPTKEPPATKGASNEPEPEGEVSASSLHPMDCVDLVIGMAKGCSFRLYDAYTRDRSTPQPDFFYGGRDDLKAAVGMEVKGWTYLKFLRKLNTGSPFDHPLTRGVTTMIWAHGQTQGAYTFNVEPSGVNMPSASNKHFYTDDELKYHGFRGNRGQFAVDLRSKAVSASTQEYSVGCSGGSAEPNRCTYRMTFKVDAQMHSVHFTLATAQRNTWIAVGVSDNRRMSETDVLLGYMADSNTVRVTDRWATGYSLPAIDSDQSQTVNIRGSQQNGITLIEFTRKCTSTDSKDISLDGSHYLVYAFGPLVNGAVSRHQVTPTVSDERIVFNCGASPSNPGQNATSEPYATAEPKATKDPTTKPEGTTEPKATKEPTTEPEGVTEPIAKADTASPTVRPTEQMLTASLNPCFEGTGNPGSSSGQLVSSVVLPTLLLGLTLLMLF